MSKKTAKKAEVWKVLKKTTHSKTLASLKLKVKPERIPGVCLVQGCNKPSATGLAQWCRDHKKAIRKEQLRLNNIVWRKRVEQGKAGHHLVYRNKPTGFAVENPDKALAIAKKGVGITEPDDLKKILAKGAASKKVKAAKKDPQDAVKKLKASKPKTKPKPKKAKAPKASKEVEPTVTPLPAESFGADGTL